MNVTFRLALSAALSFVLSCASLSGAVVEYDLVIDEITASPDGKPVKALAVNGTIPGPVLRFREGDTARLHLRNLLRSETASLHWHGLLLPNVQDGVPEVTTPIIPPGGSYTYEFPLRQSGTYWYHSHTGMQEQRGIYGAIVVTPRGGESVRADRDEVLVLSDWTREDPDSIMRTLMRGSHWYALKKGNAQSLLGAVQAGALGAWWERERSRMPPMDISDVAYDAFLVNGAPQLPLGAKPGEMVRLRLINAGAATHFFFESAAGPMTLIASDGLPVEPFKLPRLFIGMGETYDVLVKVPRTGRWELRATAQDGSGHASAWIGAGDTHSAPAIPPPDLYHMDGMLAGALDDEAPDALSRPRPLSPYRSLRAVKSTRLPASAPVRTIPLRLTGDMTRYVWSFNGETVSENAVIPVKAGEVLRLEMVNDTMMHHPMHLHGHFFRVINGQGDRSPLKHTVDVPPMGRRTVEFYADEPGDWLFHCHLLYHMMSGMARVFSYENQDRPEGHVPNLGEHGSDPWFAVGELRGQSHFGAGEIMLMDSNDMVSAMFEIGVEKESHGDRHDGEHNDTAVHAGKGAHRREKSVCPGCGTAGCHCGSTCRCGRHEESESSRPYDVEFTWDRYLNENTGVFAGLMLTNHHDERDRGFVGVRWRAPGTIYTKVHFDSRGDVRLALAREVQLTDRLGIFGEIQYDTGTEWEWSTGAEWTLTKELSLLVQHHSDYGFGGGIAFRF